MVKAFLLGGSFDPPHLGHRQILDFLHNQFPETPVFVVPARQSPHKTHSPIITHTQRLNLLDLMLQDYETVKILDWEINQSTPSYTFTTVNRFMAEFRLNPGELGLCIGDDLLHGLHTWHRYSDLGSLVHWYVFKRPDSKDNLMTPAEREKMLLGFGEEFCYTVVDNPLLPISSSIVRDYIRAKKPYHQLLDPRVYEYIRREKLYTI